MATSFDPNTLINALQQFGAPPADNFASPLPGFTDPTLNPGLPQPKTRAAAAPTFKPDTSAVDDFLKQQQKDAAAAAKLTAAADKAALKDISSPDTVAADIASATGIAPGTSDAAVGGVAEIDVTKPWQAVLASPEWQALPVAEQRKQQALWVDAQFKERVARAEQRLGKPLSKAVLAQYREGLAQAQASITPAPKFSWLNSDIVDTAVANAKSLWYGRQLSGASVEETARLQKELKVSQATLDANLSDYSKDQQKTIDLKRKRFLRENGGAELTAGQETELAVDSFNSGRLKAILGNAPSTLPSVGAAIGAGALGTLATPLVGVASGAAAGAAVGQELGFADVASGLANDISSLSDAGLAKSPQYAQLLQAHGGNAELAKAALAQAVIEDVNLTARAIGGAEGAVSGLIGVGRAAQGAIQAGAGVGGGVFGKAAAQSLAKFGLGKVTATTAVKAVADKLVAAPVERGLVKGTLHAVRAPLEQAGVEYYEEFSGNTAGNIGKQRAGLVQSTFGGSFEAGAAGALAGAGTAVGTTAGGKAINAVTGPKLDGADVIVARDNKGRLTTARSSKAAESSNIAVSRDTGIARLRNTATATLQDVMDVSSLNSEALSTAALSSNLPAEAGILAGRGVSTVIIGDAGVQGVRNHTISVNGVDTTFLIQPDGMMTPAAGTAASPEAQALADQANAMVTTLTPGVVAFANRTQGYVAPAGVAQPAAPAATTGAPNGQPTTQPTGTGTVPPPGNQSPTTQQGQTGGAGSPAGVAGSPAGTQAGTNAPGGPAAAPQNGLTAPPAAPVNPANNTPPTPIQAPATAAPQAAAPAPAPAPADGIAALNQQIDDIVTAATNNGTPNNIMARDISAAVRNAPIAVQAAYARGEGISPRNERSEQNAFAGYARNTLGVELQIQNNPALPWAQAAVQGADALAAIATDEQNQEGANPIAARAVQDLYQAAGIDTPRRVWSATIPERGERGSYDPSTHAVTFNPTTTEATVVHEYLHGLTVRGYNAVQRRADAGDQQAQDTISLVEHLRRLLPAGTYARSRPEEAMAEMFRPEALAFMQDNTYNLADMPPPARRAAERLNAAPQGTIFSLFARTIRGIYEAAFGVPVTTRREATIADLMSRVAAEFVQNDPNGANPVQVTPAAPAAPAADMQRLFDLPPDAATPGSILDETADDELVPQAGPAAPPAPPTGSAPINATGRAPGAALAAAQAGRIATPATTTRAVVQAAQQGARGGGLTPQQRGVFYDAMAKFGDKITEAFADSLLPVVRWAQALPVPEALRNALIGAMYTAPNKRDNITNLAADRFGGKELNDSLSAMRDAAAANDPNITSETVIYYAGQWATATYAPIKNQRMLAQAEADIVTAQTEYDDAVTAGASPRRLGALRAALTEAVSVRGDRLFAMAAPATVDNHVGASGRPVGLAAGMNDAQAAAWIQAAEQRFGRGPLAAAAQHLYRMNAFRMAVDLESGRVAVDEAVLFSPETESLRAEMEALVAAARAGGSNQQALETAREDFVSKLSAISKYVPTTGDGSLAIEQDALGSGYKAPNVAADKRLKGRTESLADDGITASIGAMQKSAAASGWYDFSQMVKQVYDTMTPAQRTAAGMHVTDLTIVNRLGDDLVVVGDKGYSIGDGSQLAALRKENVDGRSRLLQGFATPTRVFAYAVTQLNPIFAPINMIRDVWERSEFLRTKNLVAANGNKVDAKLAAQRMISLSSSGIVLNELRKALWAKTPGAAANSKYALLLREFEEFGGGGSKYSASLAADRGALASEVGKLANSKPAQFAKTMGKVVSRWNAVFESVSALSAYAALREQGMTKEDAAAAALDLMNFRKGGAAMPIVRVFYAFAQPAVTGGSNLIQLLKTPVGRKRAAGHVAALMALQMLMGSLAGDDDDLGRNRIDLLDDYTKDRSLPIPIPGTDTIFKMPLGFGMPMLANVIARQMWGFGKGDETLPTALGEVFTRGVLPSISPIDDLKVSFNDAPADWFAQMLAPTLAKPGVNVAINRSGLGGQLIKEDYLKDGVFKSEQGYPLTADFYKELATAVRQYTGMDFAPEQVRELMRTVAVGPARIAQQVWVDNPNSELLGRPTQVPLYKSLVSTYNPNASIGELSRFNAEGDTLLKEFNADPTVAFDARQQAVLDLYNRWQEDDKALQADARKLTQAGVAKGANPQRLALRERRYAQQVEFIKRYNAIGK